MRFLLAARSDSSAVITGLLGVLVFLMIAGLVVGAGFAERRRRRDRTRFPQRP